MGWKDTIVTDESSKASPPSWKDTIITEPSAAQKASDFAESFFTGLPGAAIAGRAGRAAADAIYSIGSDRTYSDLRKETEARVAAERAAMEKRSPKASLAGSVAGGLLAPNPASIAGRVGLNVVDAASRADSPEGALENAKTAGVVSAGLESIPYVGRAAKGFAGKLSGVAENLATKATGATGVQSQKFAKTAGRELLDQDVVTAFSTQKDVAKKAGKQLQASYNEIDSSLKKLDEMGATVSKEELLAGMDKEIAKLGNRSSQTKVLTQLKNKRLEIEEGPDVLPISAAEAEKRAYQKQANYDLDNISQDATKKTASVFQKLVEDKATAIDPKLAETFKVGKQRYAIFAPIEEAAAKRAATLNQSPYGGLLDMATIGAGGIAAGQTNNPENILYGLAAAAGRRAVAPRLASTGARGLDSLAKVIDNYANLPLKYQRQLTGSPVQIATTHLFLQETDPEYKALVDGGVKSGLRMPERGKLNLPKERNP